MSVSYIQGDTLDPLEITVVVDDEPFVFEQDDTVVLRYTTPAGDTVEVEMDIEASPGVLTYEWADGDLDLVGKYEGQIRLTREVDMVERQRTFPNNGYPVVWWVKPAI